MSDNLLDEWFPRNTKSTAEQGSDASTMHIPGFGMGTPAGENNAQWTPEPKRTKRRKDPNNPTAKDLEKIGEGLTQYIFEKTLSIPLEKIPVTFNYYGYKQSSDVDFRGIGWQPLKVEAKAWWTAKNKYFSLSRFSKNERKYLNNGIRGGYHCWVTIALLDALPTRGECGALYVITWQRWLEIEAELARRTSGQYKGRSLRIRDLDLLEGNAITRVKRRWVLPAAHWLTRTLQQNQMEETR